MRGAGAARKRENGLLGVLLAFGVVAALFFVAFFDSLKSQPAPKDGWPPSAAERRAMTERVQRQFDRERDARTAQRRRAVAAGGFSEELKTLTATILNLNGLLCAEVVEVRQLRIENQFEVTCVRYRGGSARASYVMDVKSGRAFEQ